VASILKQLGLPASEQAIAMAAHTSGSGTEAWYLARHLRGLGLQVHFLFRDSFDPAVSFPAVVGVKLSSAGHFIAVLGVNGDRVTYADPVIGLKERTLAEFHERYHFTGFHMTVATHENSP
jgi:ABC-type bacteriocin/lantibiotic exporter with double-glycine peptidase domain